MESEVNEAVEKGDVDDSEHRPPVPADETASLPVNNTETNATSGEVPPSDATEGADDNAIKSMVGPAKTTTTAHKSSAVESESKTTVKTSAPLTIPVEPTEPQKAEPNAVGNQNVTTKAKVGPGGEVIDGGSAVAREGSRERRPTAKALEFMIDQKTAHFKSSLTSFKKKVTSIQSLLSDCDEVATLRKVRQQIEADALVVIDSFNCLKSVLPQPGCVLEGKFEEFQSINLRTMERLTNVIQDLEYEARSYRSRASSRRSNCSGGSGKSKGSHRSSRSTTSKKAEAAAEVAALKAKLKFGEALGRRKLELEQLQTQLELEMASARVEAISMIEKEDEQDGASISNSPLNHREIEASNQCQSSNALNPMAETFMPKTMAKAENPIDHHNNPAIGEHRGLEAVSASLSRVAQSLSDQANLSRLPAAEPGVFNGDPLTFLSWKSAFETLIESRGIPAKERIHFLKRYLAGEALAAVQDCFMYPSDEAYYDAKELLNQRYGRDYKIASAYRERLKNWPKVGNRDATALRTLAGFLRHCRTAMRSNDNMNILNDEQENSRILAKLPDWMVTRWARQVAAHREAHQRYPPFEDFTSFVVKEAEIACDPVASISAVKIHTSAPFTGNKPMERRQLNQARSFGTTLRPVQGITCSLCQKNHHLDDCFLYLKKPLEERKEFAREHKLCFGCLAPGHRSRVCQKRIQCKTCHKLHPSSLHGDRPSLPGKASAEQSTQVTEAPTQDTTSGQGTTPSQGIATAVVSCIQTQRRNMNKSSMIVPVWVSHETSPHEVLVYALLDNQSDTSFMLKKTSEELGLKGSPAQLLLSTMSAEDSLIDTSRISNIQVRAYDGNDSVTIRNLYTRDVVPANHSHIPTPEMTDRWPHLKPMAQNLMPISDIDIGLLIGYDCPRALYPTKLIPPIGDSPFAQRTILGWGIVGVIDNMELEHDPIGVSHQTMLSCDSTISFRTQVKEVMDPQSIIKLLARDFAETSCGDTKMSQQDLKFINIMHDNISRLEDGHYQMPLPFKNDKINLPNNRSAALSRLRQLERRFHRDPIYHERYKTVIGSMISEGYAELAPSDETPNPGSLWYLPHHGVINAKKPQKLRVVFDGSPTLHGQSLNNNLLHGPDLTNSLIGVLCRFRKEDIALMCDIEAMFHQFRVSPHHRDFLRFLWWPNGELSEEPAEFRMTAHLFGATSSPACANFALKKIADDFQEECGYEAAQFVRGNFYVDDGLTSVPTEEDCIALVQKTQQLCQKGALRLHKFTSNSRRVIQTIQQADRATTVRDMDLTSDCLPMERALGVEWCAEVDTFRFQINLGNKGTTRRGILSTVCSIFDPLGLIAPVTLVGKQILQELCRQGLDWDDPIPEPLEMKYQQWVSDLTHLGEITINRCYKPQDFGPVVTAELHNFSDASLVGYGQCSYLRLLNAKGKVQCSLVLGKARVTPLKAVTIPRLELTAAVLSTRIATLLANELQFDNLKQFYWTDSKVVLSYIQNEEKRFHVYVANRISEIRERSEVDQWNHVPTDLNPADSASRGLTTCELKQSTWLTGPEFLWEPQISYPSNETATLKLGEDDPEVKQARSLATQCSFAENPVLDYLRNLSSWKKMCRLVAYLKKLGKKTTGSPFTADDAMQSKKINLSVTDYQEAAKTIVRLVQRQSFGAELHQLERGHRLKSSSALCKLDPFLDDGFFRVGGRLHNAQVPNDVKHPLVLPKDHHVSMAIVSYFHQRMGHQGKNPTVNEVRHHGFWIVGINRIAARLISACVTCRKLRGQLQEQKMANLPPERLEPSPPFTYCGVDFFGPWSIKEGRRQVKRWGVLFTCFASRAIHVETANSLDSSAFINALRRFISIRGPLRTLRSDCGTNFVGAQRELAEALQEMDHDAVKEHLLANQCDYIMNPPSASHMGGVWEAQIRSVRRIFDSLLTSCGHQLDDDMLRTLLCESAAIVNCRPLTTDSIYDPTSLNPLSPQRLLTMKSSIILPPPGKFDKADMYCKRRWRRVQHLTNEFWHRWKREYLHTLQQRQKWSKPKRNLQVGDVVIVKDDNVIRSQWRLGRVTEVTASKDGLVRKVRLLIGDASLDDNGRRVRPATYLERPIHKLVLLLESE